MLQGYMYKRIQMYTVNEIYRETEIARRQIYRQHTDVHRESKIYTEQISRIQIYGLYTEV